MDKFYGQIFKAKNAMRVPDDQWVCFLFKDDAFAAILPQYRDTCEQLGADAEQLAAVDRLIERCTAWRVANHLLCKTPDAAGEILLDRGEVNA